MYAIYIMSTVYYEKKKNAFEKSNFPYILYITFKQINIKFK